MNGKFLILVAEDDENDAFILKRALNKAGISDPVQIVCDGQQAVEYLSGADKYADRDAYPLPGLVIFDIKMPRKDGFEALQWTRRQPHLDQLPVMMLSSSGELCDIEKAYKLGANAYMVKRPQINEFCTALKGAFHFWKETAGES